MASSGSSLLKDIDERFCQCPVCLQQYREPKLLPCLHRYCSDCLKQLIEKTQGAKVISCPECRDEFAIPREGVEGFKTDFNMKNIIEYIQIQKSLEDEKVRECYSCSKQLKVMAYCFKCNGFLCNQCHETHMISKSLKDHKQHALSLEDLKSRNMTLEKLADLKEAPRCQNHLKELCFLCCRSCDNLPICVACVHGIHKSHDISDVKIIASEEREKLQNELINLNQYKERMLKMPEVVERVTGDLTSNVRDMKEKSTARYEKDIEMVTNEIEKLEEDYKLKQTEIENNKESELMEKTKQMDEEMKQIKIKYDNIFDELKEENKCKLENLKRRHEEDLQKSRQKLAILVEEFQTFISTLESRHQEGLKKLEEISQQIVHVTERYKNLTTTGYSVLETRNDWAAVQCIPDICKAIDPLSKDMKREFPELETLSRMEVNPTITEEEESPVSIEEIERRDWRITDIKCGDDGSAVITGYTPDFRQSHITVINMKRKVLRKKLMQQTFSQLNLPVAYCAFLSKFKVVTVCDKNQIGIFDIRDASYNGKNISDIVRSWPVRRRVSCVTTDLVNKHVLVGGSMSRDVYVFDDQLNYHHTLILPEVIVYPHDMTISEGYLLVCNWQGKGAFVVSMQGPKGKLISEFKRPDLDQDTLKPLSVCKDSHGFVYILWMTGNSYESGRRVVAQYTQDGRQLLTNKQIDCKYAKCVTTAKIGQTEKLLVASLKLGKLHIYNIK